MTWSRSNKANAKRLQQQFQAAGINCTRPGFCDDREFLAVEQQDPRILERYAHLIEAQEYTTIYLDEARRKIQIVAEAVRVAVEADGNDSRCVHASAVIGRMLDELGVWNYQAKATLTITFPNHPEIEPVHFWALQNSDRQTRAPHAISVAPPFGVIDVTARYQPYPSDVKRNLLPEKVVSDDFKLATYEADDIAEGMFLYTLDAQGVPFKQYMERRRSKWLEVMNWLPARAVEAENVHLKYVVIAVGAMEQRLQDLGAWKFAKRTPWDIYQQDVLPKI